MPADPGCTVVENKVQNAGLQDIEAIILAPLNFKAKLTIGEDAYTSLRVKNTVLQVWDVAGVATTVAVVTGGAWFGITRHLKSASKIH